MWVTGVLCCLLPMLPAQPRPSPRCGLHWPAVWPAPLTTQHHRTPHTRYSDTGSGIPHGRQYLLHPRILFILIVVAYKVVYHVAFVAFIKLSCACVTPLTLGSDVLLFARCVHS